MFCNKALFDLTRYLDLKLDADNAHEGLYLVNYQELLGNRLFAMKLKTTKTRGFMGIRIIELLMLLALFGFIHFIFAFVDILRSEFAGNNKLIWLLSVIFVPFAGSIAYFIIGRKQKIKPGNV